MLKSQAQAVARPTSRKEILRLIKKKQGEREEEFKRLRSLYSLGREEERIVGLGWDNLVESLQRRELTATRVLEAFLAKALVVCEKCNPVTEFIPQAHVWAKELDSLAEVKGPLHGIPFCVKDDTNVIDMDTTHGFGKRLFQPATESAVIVKVLQDLGAIPFAKTNVPQGLCNIGGINRVWGKTTNAHNPNLSPGGSSSGTGALVGAGGALFGTGTDLGGSLRVPAHFNGVSTVKPSVNRISVMGCVAPIDPLPVGVNPVVGVIGQTPSIVAAVYKAMIESGKNSIYDPIVPPIPWNSTSFESKKKLRIGYNTSMPFFPPIGDSVQTVLDAKAALESLGHTLVETELPDPLRFFKAFGQLMLADTRDFKRVWKGEDVTEDNKLMTSSLNAPLFLLPILRSLTTKRWIPSLYSKSQAIFLAKPARTSAEMIDAVAEKNQIIREILEEWEKLELDGMIHNVLPIPAPHAKIVSKLNPSMAYTVLWNLVEFPAGVVTVGQESGQRLAEFDDQGDVVFRAAKELMSESIGAPIGIQVIGKPFQEELVLRIMKELEPFNTFKPKCSEN